ncbi:ice-binding family protein [Crenothrix sp.]|uniref:DUF7933 domain-containing protein n=1 Tax=Crenothrix sp. TaxID=3100433 RepID=UPI00374CDCE8
MAATAPSLGTAQSFAVLGGSTVTNTGPTIIATGDLGVSPGSAITGFPPGTVTTGTIHAGDAVAAQAQSDNAIAYNNLASQACNTTYGIPTNIGGMTLVPGVYCFSSSAQLTGTLTLDAQGDPSAVWVFKVGSTLITAVNSSVQIINGGQQCNVFWQVGSSATLGTGTSFVGNILALASISLNSNTDVSGRALARNGAVTMDSNAVSISVCAVSPGTSIPPTLGKAFSPATISADATSMLTLTLSNPDTKAASLSSPLTDTLPTGMVVAGSASTNCGGTVTATTGSSTVTLTGGSIPPNNGSCTVTVPVTAANGGNYINSLAAGVLKTSNGNNAFAAISTLTVNAPVVIPPSLGKAFSPATINAGGTSTLTLTLSNSDNTAATMTAALTDTLPSGLTIAGSAANTCGGTVTAPMGGSTVTLTGGTIPANSNCTVKVSVTATDGGNYINALAAGVLQTGNGGNAAPAIATLTVNSPVVTTPTLSKAFSPATMNTNGTSTLTITLTNPDVTAASIIAPLTDTLPNGLVVDGNASTTCGGLLTATAGASTVILTGGSIPANNGSCVINVDVTAANGGNYINSLAAGALQTNNGNNANATIATLTVNSPVSTRPTLSKAFSPATINADGTSTLIITLSNPGDTAASLTAPLIDTLPKGIMVMGSVHTTCSKLPFAASARRSKITLKNGVILANSFCTVTVKVTATKEGNYLNSLAAGVLQTSNGSNAAQTIATLTVNPPVGVAPMLGKSFSPATITAKGTSILSLTLSNSSARISTLSAPLIDILPNGMLIVGAASNTCGGTLTATPGSSKVILVGGSIPAYKSCVVTVKVTASNVGNYINSLAAGALQTNNGNNISQAISTLTVSTPSNPSTPSAPVSVALSKSFSPATIESGDNSLLTITLSNVGAKAASLTAPLIDNLPSGVLVDGYASTTCGGKVMVDDWTVVLKNGTIPAHGSCTVSVNVIGLAEGCSYNSLAAGDLQTNKGNNAGPTVATLTVLPAAHIAPSLGKVFKPAIVPAKGLSMLSITLKNPNSTLAKLTAPLTDTFPIGMVISGKAVTTCGGTLTAAPGSSKVILKACSIPAKSSCTVKVQVTAKSKGSYKNKLPAGALKTNKGNNAASASATLTVKALVAK